ncbi:hypothetical protein A7A76_13485 [Lysobacter enzymogenes]|uniref:hypothetical protein n=1 Tax=Lysobacter enzymogenes TaxID=69 RepID=UPI0019D2A058|nr:hypothetical protein [Lysobacter enzymogenes]MBN7135736.1 hypothetical protein [Lysobacter enzymogenes]
MTAAPARTAATSLLLALCAAGAGCATVAVDTDAGTIRASGLFGARVLPYAQAPFAVRSRGLGVFAGPGEFSLGLHSRVALYAPDPAACRVVLIGQRPDETRRLIQALEQGGVKAADICTDTGEARQ